MILLTGATGLLGSQIARDLLKTNTPFRALYRGKIPAHMEDIASSIQWVQGDLTDNTALEQYMEGVDTIIHSAAIVSFHKKHKDELFRVNVEATQNLVNLALVYSVQNFIYVSSTGALPRTAVREELDESRKWEHSQLNTYYGYTKYLGELEVWRGQEEGLNVGIVNPCVILGPGDPGRSSARLFDYVLNERKFYTDGIISYVDVRDVSRAIRTLLEGHVFGERFVVCAGTTDYLHFFTRMAHYLGRKPPSIRINSKYVQIFAMFEGMRAWLTRSMPLITRETAMQTRLRTTYSNQKIREQLSFNFRELDETLEWCSGRILKK